VPTPRRQPRPLTVPADQRLLPRRQRQHPFRALPGEEADRDRDLTQFIAGIDDMIVDIILREMTRAEARHAQWKADIQQAVRMHLATRAMLMFDAWRVPKTKPGTYAHRVIVNRVRDILKRLRREQRTAPIQLDHGYEAPGPNGFHDDRIRELATQIIRDPMQFGFSRPQARVLIAVANRPPGTTYVELSRQLGYRSPTSLTTMLKRIKERITSLDIMDFQTAHRGKAGQPQTYRFNVVGNCRDAHAQGDGQTMEHAAQCGADGERGRAGVPVHGGARAA
jgi:DNA-directed RNA polymerase specialized sigma24 family protein